MYNFSDTFKEENANRTIIIKRANYRSYRRFFVLTCAIKYTTTKDRRSTIGVVNGGMPTVISSIRNYGYNATYATTRIPVVGRTRVVVALLVGTRGGKQLAHSPVCSRARFFERCRCTLNFSLAFNSKEKGWSGVIMSTTRRAFGKKRVDD